MRGTCTAFMHLTRPTRDLIDGCLVTTGLNPITP
jgi:hypothetical protein